MSVRFSPRTRVRTVTREDKELVHQDLVQESVEVTRVLIDREVDAAPAVRRENVHLRDEHVHLARKPVDGAATPAYNLFQERTIEAETNGKEAVFPQKARVVEVVRIGGRRMTAMTQASPKKSAPVVPAASEPKTLDGEMSVSEGLDKVENQQLAFSRQSSSASLVNLRSWGRDDKPFARTARQEPSKMTSCRVGHSAPIEEVVQQGDDVLFGVRP